MNCHICNNSCETFTHFKTTIIYYHCLKCEYIFKSPEYYQDLNTQKERYNLHENNEKDTRYRAYFQRFVDFVLPQVHDVSTALDFGCGKTSLLASLLEEQGIACDYYDPIYHPNTLDDTKKYKLIVSTEVFEHLHQPCEVFERLLATLHGRGYLAIQTEFHSNDRGIFEKWWYPQDPTHIVFFRPKTFEILAERYGCSVIAVNYKNMILLQKNKA